MTDAELVEWLRANASWGDDRFTKAADRIEALTAERDQAWEMVAEADTRLGQSLADAVRDKADNERLREALETCLETMGRADFADGWCCCGDDMLKHSSLMDCGHTPVDMGEYHASLAIKNALAALNTGKEPSHE